MQSSPSWSLSLKTAGAAPLTLAEAKAHGRVVVADDDTLLTSYLLVAADVVEKMSGQALLAQTWIRTATDFPCDDGEPIVLPRPPIVSVTSVQYRDENDVLQTWDPAKYRVITVGRFGAIVPTIGNGYPLTRNAVTAGGQAPDAVQIEFVCGNANAAAVPARLMLAQKVLVAYWYANPELAKVGDLPMGLDALIGSPAHVDPCW